VSDRRQEAPSHDASAVSASGDLPKYELPPVVEVAMSVQFDELPALQPVHYGLLWERLREDYPKTEHHPPLGSIVELYGKQGAQRATLQLESAMPIGRCWFLSEDGLRLIQVQPDRFVLNWRKLDTDTKYPSYESLRTRFVAELTRFLEFVSEQGLGEFTPTQCELTYVNHIDALRGRTARGELERVFSVWSSGPNLGFDFPAIEEVKLNWQYRFDEGSQPLGRLHVQVQTATRTRDASAILMMNLTARGAPIGAGIDGILQFSDKGHAWIVHGFTALTTKQMHQLWRRTR
jgi:uncharacterized protein (TIGR04255 family)